jgi:hypothetical protein
MTRDRELLRHYLGAVAYRAQKALRGAPPHYPGFDPGHQVRTPVEILRHMTSLMGYARTFFVGGTYPVKPEPLPTFEADAPVPPENFIFADVRATRLGPDQPLPARPDEHWPERPA